MSTGEEKTRSGGQQLQHTLNMEAIVEAQATNAAVLSDYREELSELVKAYHEIQRGFLGVKLSPCDMTWLGAGAAGVLTAFPSSKMNEIINNASIFPTFQSLERRGALPGKCRITLENSETQAWVEKIWNGECVYHVNAVDYRSEDDVCFTLSVATTDDEYLSRFVGYHSGKLSMDLHTKFDLDYNERELLQVRMWHHFLRQYAYLVPPHLLDIILNSTFEVALTSKKCKDAFLDWQILRADLALNLPPTNDDRELSDEIHKRLVLVGCALLASNRWEEASSFFVELARTFKNDLGSYGNAAKAFQLTGKYDAALESYVNALGRLVEQKYHNPDVNEHPFDDALGNMMYVHYAKLEDALSRHDKSKPLLVLDEDSYLAVAYLALLRISEPTTLEQFDAHGYEYFGFTKADCRSMLKDKFQKPKQAKREILKLMRSGSIDKYKKNLLHVLRPNTALPIRSSSRDTRLTDDVMKTCAEGLIKFAHAYGKKSVSEDRRRCASCCVYSQGDNVFKCCPCGKVYYCSTKCQHADWKRHKKFCALQRKRQEQQAKKNGGSDDQLECSTCGKFVIKSQIKWCPCRGQCYCCKPCQVSDWREHKQVCPWHLEQKKHDA